MAHRPLRPAKKPVLVRRTAVRAGGAKLAYGLFRFAVYGFLGCALEIFFYNLVRNARRVPVLEYLFQFQWRVDDRLGLNGIWETAPVALYGQCSLWMFLVYAVASFSIEWVYRNFPGLHVGARALAYGLIIFLWEWASGWLLFWGTGYRIWYYADPGNFFQMTSFFILPLWCATGLFVEYVYRQLMDPDLVRAIETASLDPQFTPPSPPPPPR